MEDAPGPGIMLPAIIVSIILFGGVLWAFQSARNRQGSVVLPGGITYIGPTPSPAEVPLPIATDMKWTERKGTIFPYTFQYPESLSLGIFPSDPYDSVTVFYDGTEANTNIFLRVEDLTKLNKKHYIGKPEEYARNWWKDYNWKGVESVTAFTNSNGLKGYRAKYLNEKNETPYDHVFFEIPGKEDIIIWLSGRLFTSADFDRLVDSVSWKN